MGKVWYGNLSNRLEEGKNYTGREIKVGDDVTMYHWSDRTCYYVTGVVDQKHITVRRYYTCADKSKPGGMGHQNWVYFKSLREMHNYLGLAPISEEKYEDADREEAWTFRYGKWMREHTVTEMKYPEAFSKRERDAFAKHGFCKYYTDLSGKVSFGVKEYYYDWEF